MCDKDLFLTEREVVTLLTSAILMPVFYVKYLEHIVTHGWSYKNARFYCPLQSRLHHRITFSLQFPATVNLWTIRISFLAEPMQNSKVSSCFPYCRFIWIHLVFIVFGQKVESSLLSRKLEVGLWWCYFLYFPTLCQMSLLYHFVWFIP